MFDRFVSMFSLAVVVASLILFACYAWWIASGASGQVDGLFAMGASLLAAAIFTWRFLDPADLEPLSVVKAA